MTEKIIVFATVESRRYLQQQLHRRKSTSNNNCTVTRVFVTLSQECCNWILRSRITIATFIATIALPWQSVNYLLEKIQIFLCFLACKRSYTYVGVAFSLHWWTSYIFTMFIIHIDKIKIHKVEVRYVKYNVVQTVSCWGNWKSSFPPCHNLQPQFHLVWMNNLDHRFFPINYVYIYIICTQSLLCINMHHPTTIIKVKNYNFDSLFSDF